MTCLSPSRSGSWYTAELGRPDVSMTNELGTLTREKTWLSRLAETVPVGSAFTRYGTGTTWVSPERRTVGSLAMVHSQVGALAVPILDAAARRAATRLFQTGHRVVVFPFRVFGQQLPPRKRVMRGHDLFSQQMLALRRLDGLGRYWNNCGSSSLEYTAFVSSTCGHQGNRRALGPGRIRFM